MLIGKRIDHLVIVSCHVTLVNNILLRLTFAITGVQKQSESALLRVRVDGVVRLLAFE